MDVLKRIFILLVLSILLSLTCSAEESMDLDPDRILSDLSNTLSDSVREELPEGIPKELEKGIDVDIAAVASAFSPSYLLKLISKAVQPLVSSCLRCLCKLTGCILICSLLSALPTAVEQTGRALSFLTALILSIGVLQIAIEGFTITVKALESVTVFMRALLPTIAMVYASGGNWIAGGAEEAGLMMILQILQTLSADGLSPMVKTAFCLSIAAHIAGEERLNGLCTTVCRIIMMLLSFLMTILTAVMSYQHAISASADGLLLRSVKFAAAGVIPIIGGSVSEMMGTAGGAVSFLRATVGTVGTVSILILLLIPFAQLLGFRTALTLGSMLGNAMGCRKEGSLMQEICSVFDLMMAILAVCFLTLLFSLALLVRCVPPLA